MRRLSLVALLALVAMPAFGQDITPPGFRLRPLSEVTEKTPAKELFGRVTVAAGKVAHPIGFYSKGCMTGAMQLPTTGKTWQVMRLSRNRNWGNPLLIRYLIGLSRNVARRTSWKGLLVGDIAQPRGGPMRTGHASHQIGLDADIWLTPMPGRTLSLKERETMSAGMMVRSDRRDVSSLWTPEHMAVVRMAAQDPRIERIFINAAIKKAMCRDATGDRSWLGKVRPMWGHDYHFHVRMVCPPGQAECKPQAPPKGDEGCGKELDWWLSDAVLHPPPPKHPPKKRAPLVMANLPKNCEAVLAAPPSPLPQGGVTGSTGQ